MKTNTAAIDRPDDDATRQPRVSWRDVACAWVVLLVLGFVGVLL